MDESWIGPDQLPDPSMDHLLDRVQHAAVRLVDDLEALARALANGAGDQFAGELTPAQFDRLAALLATVGETATVILALDVQRTYEREGR